MKRFVPFFLLLILPACQVSVSRVVTPTPVPSATLIKSISPTTEPSPVPAITTDPDVDTYYWLILGGDYREHRQGTRYGDKTDVMLLVQMKMIPSGPEITVIQFPRNFYHPVEAFPDMWLFHVYGREGFTGLHYYFQEVFDIPLHGIFYMNMDNFVTFVDEAFPSKVPIRTVDDVTKMDGDMILAHVRDNPNNWEGWTYDSEGRQFWVLRSLAVAFQTRLSNDFFGTAKIILDNYGHLFKSDISDFNQYVFLVSIGVRLMSSDWQQLGLARMTNSPFFMYGDTPLEVRGWIATEGYKPSYWMDKVKGG